MPRGRGSGRRGGHKGQHRRFTNEEQLSAAAEKKRKEIEWRRARGEEVDSDEVGSGSDEEEEKAPARAERPERGAADGAADVDPRAARTVQPGDLPPSSSEESSEEEEEKPKGVGHLIEIENPNHMVKKENRKVGDLNNDDTKPQLSRREREELEKQAAAERYRKMHLAGKTDEARADMARLAIVRKQREEAAKKKEEEKKAADAAAAEKKAAKGKK